MRALRFLNVAVLSVLVGSAALVYSQDEKQQDDKRQEEPKAQPKQDEAKPAHQNDPKQDMRGEKQDEKAAPVESRENAKPEERNHAQENMDAHAAKQEQGHAENAHPAGKGGRIPDDKFHAHYGQAHHFSARTVIHQGQSNFSYGGYSFQFVDAWPVGWGYTDDCYIDYIDGEYYLIDLAHPGMRLALIVNL